MENYRKTYAHISLTNFISNIHTFKNRLSDSTKLMAVVKADAYGHGAVKMSQVAIENGADYLAVAILEEALELRKAGITAPILVLGPTTMDGLQPAIDTNITLTIFKKETAQALVKLAKHSSQKPLVHLKIDTGMTRIGVRSGKEALEIVEILQAGGISAEGIFTHFADADNVTNLDYTDKQYHTFVAILNYLNQQGFSFPIQHCANTATVYTRQEYQLDMVRIGIGLYGYAPDKKLLAALSLKPVLTLVTHPSFIKHVPKGQSIGYSCTYKTTDEATIATLPIGYADGLPRQLTNAGSLFHQGIQLPIVGRVCMDQTMIDSTLAPHLAEDSELVLFGDRPSTQTAIFTIAEFTQTNHYAILCGITNRVPRYYE
ncbi:alanine racemase [Lacticigenium naphthae]|uniref:alanine racemase n=1 Tax=Lacticigenium naphthae TaxID=515351 RepID=UPI00040E31E7|nr:alanine racemase [Lacticigenium naphthae]